MTVFIGEPITLQGLWKEMKELAYLIQSPSPYPCDKKTGFFVDEDEKGSQIITATTQLKISDIHTGEIKVFQPKLIQNCMKPDEIYLSTLTIKEPQLGTLQIENDFESSIVELSGKTIEIGSWTASLTKASCLPCVGCGRCSW